jgi:hypothetical protein
VENSGTFLAALDPLGLGFDGPVEVVVHLAGTARYIDDGGMAAVA